VNAMLDSDVIRNGTFSLFGWRWCLDGPNVNDEVHMDSRAGRMQGKLVLGSVLDSPPSGGVTWYPLAIRGRWEVKFNAMLLNAQEIFVHKQQVALIDSGTSFIATSQGNLEAVREPLPDARILQRDNQQDMLVVRAGDVQRLAFRFRSLIIHIPKEDVLIGSVAQEKRVLCIIGLRGLHDGERILGCRFLSNVIAHFDLGGNRVGMEHQGENHAR
jgi:hypothetical protein